LKIEFESEKKAPPKKISQSYHSIDNKRSEFLTNKVNTASFNQHNSLNLNKSVARSDENPNEIHIYLPNKNNQELEQTKIIDSHTISASLNRLKANYDVLKQKISKKSKNNEKIDIKHDENDLFILQNNMNEMNRLLEQLEEKKMHIKETNIMVLLEKERKKFAKDKEKYVQSYEEQIIRLKSDLEKSNSSRKEFEIKLKMIESLKFDLDKKFRALDQEKKTMETELIKSQREFSINAGEIEKYRILYSTKEKELKGVLDRLEICNKQKEILEEESKKLLPKISKLETENIYLKSDNERIINESHLRMNELKRELMDLNNKIKGLNYEITGYKNENDELKSEIKEERNFKERIMIEKMNLESKNKEFEIEIANLKRRLDELLRKPPQIIREVAQAPLIPPIIEKIIEKPVEKIVYIENPDILKELEFLRSQNIAFEKEIFGLQEQLHCLNIELNDKTTEIEHWRRQFQQLERRKLDEIEVISNEKFMVFGRENEDLKYRFRFLTEELKRQSELNQEKNQNLATQIRALNEKNLQLENILQYYKYKK